MSSYKLTKKAEADLASLVDFSVARLGSDATLRLLDNLDRRIEALARHEYEGPEARIGSRARPVRRWPVPPYWLYYDRAGGILRVLRIYHGAASRSAGSRWESGAAAARIKSVGVGHFDFTVPVLARVPGLWNTEECDAVLTTVRDAEWSPPRERAAKRVIDERVRSNGGGDAAGVDRPHAAGLFQTCRWTEK